MATYFVWSGATGANNGTSWTDAYTALGSAVTAASTSGDVIKVHKTHTESLTVATTYTFANNVAVVCVDKDSSDALSVMNGTTGYITSTTTVNFDGAYKVFMYGIFVKSSAGGAAMVIALARSDGAHFECEYCSFSSTTSASTGVISLGYDGANRNGYIKLTNCNLSLAHTGSLVSVYCEFEMFGGSINPITSGYVLGNFSSGFSSVTLNGVDISSAAATIVKDMTTTARKVVLINCKLHASTTPLATQTITNLSSGQVYLYDCSSDDTHYKLAHYNALGSTVISTSIYANDNPTYDGTNKCSWVVASTANATFYAPYVSPWIDKYHSGTSAITPYLECLRDGSATAYKDNEVWAEFMYKGTSGYPITSLVSDRMAILGTAADQASSSKAGSDWTGENATSWFGKIDSGSAITPAEIGHLRARVCVGLASATIYVDPQIRGV